jgi:arylsulfatase A-like enzyme
MDDLRDAASDSKASAAEDETVVDHDRSLSVHRRQLQCIATDGARFLHSVPDGPKEIDEKKMTKRILQCHQDQAPSSRKVYVFLALVIVVVCGAGYLFLDYPLIYLDYPVFYQQQARPREEQASGKVFQRESTAQAAAQRKGKRPNLVFILTDQQRFDAIGRVQSELNVPKQSRIHTPNLDSLSREGAFFRNAYTHCPVCVPARTSMLTGRTIENTGVRSNYGKNEKEIHAAGVDAGVKIPKLRTYDEILVQDHGYIAEYYGKWHTTESKGYVYSNDVTANNCQYAWFGKYEDDNVTKHLAMCLNPDYSEWLMEKKIDKCRDKTEFLSVGMACVPDGFSLTARQGEAALQALRRLGRAGNPFSLHLSIKAPHPPFIPTSRYYDMYDPDDMPIPPSLDDEMENSGYAARQLRGQAKQLRNHRNVQQLWATYYGFVTEIDEMVGTILTTIDELGISNNTMVVFTSDHGEMLGSHGLMGKFVRGHVQPAFWMIGHITLTLHFSLSYHCLDFVRRICSRSSHDEIPWNH